MKKFIKSLKFLRDELKDQPLIVRQLMFALCLVTVVSLSGVIWFDSVEKRLFFSLNPQQDKRERFLAERDQNTESMFADIGQVFGNFKSMTADILSLFKLSETGSEITASQSHPFPLSEDK
jgi:hypothetical protein